MNTDDLPTTLHETVAYFADEDRAFEFMKMIRWQGGVAQCPDCYSEKSCFLPSGKVWKCKECKRKYSLKVGTVFEDSPIKLGTWICAVWLAVNAKNGISSYEIHRALGVTQKTGWFMLQRIRLALQNGTIVKMAGTVEADETFIGGKARNMHKGKRRAKGRGANGKQAVQGLLERHGKGSKKTSRVVLRHVADCDKDTLQGNVRKYVLRGSEVHTDEALSYQGLGDTYTHEVVNHAETYVRGKVHTNGLENFWALLKRCIKGTHVSIEPFHLFRYLDEQAFRFNERKDDDQGRFLKAIFGIIGKRLTYKTLIGDNDPLPVVS